MTKNARTLIIGAAVLALFAGGYFALSAYNQQVAADEAAAEAAATVYAIDIPATDVIAFSYLSEGQTLAFTKSGENWVYDADASIDIDESAVATMLGNLNPLTATQALVPDSSVDYGFDSPTNTITVTTADGATIVTIGIENPLTGDYYVKTGAGEQIFLVGSSLVTAFGQTVADITAEPEETETPDAAANTAAAAAEVVEVPDVAEGEVVEVPEAAEGEVSDEAAAG
ncbi:MAG: DUF4340 domain-containing protein [Propionibacteriaceae bacterium]|jgi:hypothetical protein|nr:DUF4340 domain-containing protein [Propionibacteriaceae bacterium]